jgi:hypothetical protein
MPRRKVDNIFAAVDAATRHYNLTPSQVVRRIAGVTLKMRGPNPRCEVLVSVVGDKGYVVQTGTATWRYRSARQAVSDAVFAFHKCRTSTR